MTRKLIFIPLILVFLSCTVTKRVHRSGFHIQWRKIERTQSLEKKKHQVHNSIAVEKPKTKAQTSTNSQLPNLKANSTVTLPETDGVISMEQASTEEVQTRTTFLDYQEERLNENTKKAFHPSAVHKSSRPIFWRMNPNTLRKLGIFFILLGAMLLFASLLVSWGAFSGNGSGAWLNFFLDLIDLSGWFWLLFFIVIFILISYLFFLFVLYVLGGPVAGSLIGLALLAFGIFLFVLAKRREG